MNRNRNTSRRSWKRPKKFIVLVPGVVRSLGRHLAPQNHQDRQTVEKWKASRGSAIRKFPLTTTNIRPEHSAIHIEILVLR